MPDETPSQPPLTPQNALLQLALFAAEQLLTHAPALFERFVDTVSVDNVTLDELRAERASMARTSYKDFVPDSKIPPSEQT